MAAVVDARVRGRLRGAIERSTVESESEREKRKVEYIRSGLCWQYYILLAHLPWKKGDPLQPTCFKIFESLAVVHTVALTLELTLSSPQRRVNFIIQHHSHLRFEHT